jgi:hypothetical protein
MSDLPSVVKVTTVKDYYPPVIKINNEIFKVKE